MTTSSGAAQVGPARTAPAMTPREPRLAVSWEPRRQNFTSSALAVFGGPQALKRLPTRPCFRDSWVEWPLPKRALLVSALWHIAVIAFPFSLLQGLGQRPEDSPRLTLPRIEVAWYGPVRNLPPLVPTTPTGKSEPAGRAVKSSQQRGADAFHPRQTIVSAPTKPTHPRQTLIQPDIAPEPPKILPQLPNIVQWGDTSRPTLRHLQISRAVLAKLHPRKRRTRPLVEVPLPQVPNLEKQADEFNMAFSAMRAPRPLLPVAPASVSHAIPKQMPQDAAAAPDVRPDVNAGFAAGDTELRRLVAISANPAAPPPAGTGNMLVVPAGNLAARFSVSPEGPRPGFPGSPTNGVSAAMSAGNGSGPPGISITGGDSRAASRVSGAAVGLSQPSGGARPDEIGANFAPPRPLPASPDPHAGPMNPVPGPTRTQPLSGFDAAKTGAAPEEIFGPKRVYTLRVNMPNLASVTGSWILSFVELPLGEPPAGARALPHGELTGPVPVRKVDPKYPPVLRKARVEGEVVLYAIIRKNGSVDSIQLVRGIDPQLDSNAMEALSRWKFHPAERRGTPVELEAIVHIPFRAIAPLYGTRNLR